MLRVARFLFWKSLRLVMGKVNIGLRGWRFDEDEVFDADGDLKPLGTMEPETRDRIVRLSTMMGEPCDACYLIHGDENIQECNVARIVYGDRKSVV